MPSILCGSHSAAGKDAQTIAVDATSMQQWLNAPHFRSARTTSGQSNPPSESGSHGRV